MPSLTYPNTVSLLTGRFPGHHGVVGNAWFDRTKARMRRYDSVLSFRDADEHFHGESLFEVLDDRLTAAVQFHTRRGADLKIDNPIDGGLDWLRRKYRSFDRRSADSLMQVAGYANWHNEWPTLILHYFPGVDEVAHRVGVESDHYARALRNVDEQIGRICTALEEAGIADSTYFVLVSDHGHVRLDDRQETAADALRESGMRVYDDFSESRWSGVTRGSLRRYDAVVVNGAARCQAIHLRGRAGWDEPASPERVAAVAAALADKRCSAVGLIAARIAGQVHVATPTGSAIIKRSGTARQPRYELSINNGDPLGLASEVDLAAFVAAGPHGSREWLAATAGSRYPDLVPQLCELFDSPRAGDVVLFASDHGAFDDWNRSGHGSCLASDMRIPMFFAGPGLPAGGSIDHARLVDVAPTLLALLGLDARITRLGAIDGVSIADELRRTETADVDER
jgi:hypothetical protein